MSEEKEREKMRTRDREKGGRDQNMILDLLRYHHQRDK